MSNLAIEKIEENLFMGTPEKSGLKRVFGGQVLAQALMAAFQTASSRSCHSFHGYFLRPGSPEKTILYEVDRVRDGKSFATRRVVGIQDGLAIFNMLASFQKNEAGLNHQFDMPSVSGPDKLPTDEERLNRNKELLSPEQKKMLDRARPIEIRRLEEQDFTKPRKMPPVQHIWLRCKVALSGEISQHQSLLAYASDMGLLSTASFPHGLSWLKGLQTASLDHSMWFHNEFRIDEWVLAVIESPVSARGRGFNRGLIYSRDGKLVASVSQEGLMRLSRQ